MIRTAKEQFRRTFNLISIWILVAVAFAFLYYLLPGELINSRTGEPITNFLEFIYFSFITILTTGYGDIVAQGFIRVLTAIEGLLGWILFGLIVYKVVSVKEDVILKEIHKLSNDQYLSRIRNSLFISHTNLVRFVKEVRSKKIQNSAIAYELGVISTTLRSNIEDAVKFLLTNQGSINGELEEEEINLLVGGIDLCINNFVMSLDIYPKKFKEDSVIMGNVNKIVESVRKIHTSCERTSKEERKELKDLCSKLEYLEEYNEN
jgi:hypothetical protein